MRLDRLSAFFGRQADNAGRATWVWAAFVVLLIIEAIGESAWPRQIPAVEDFGWRAMAAIWPVVPTWAVGADPYQALVLSRWSGRGNLAIAFVLVALLAVLRTRRGTGINPRSLRLAAVGVARLIMLAYVLHLVVWRLTPVLAVLTVMSTVVVVPPAAAAIGLMRWFAGRRPADQAGPSSRSLGGSCAGPASSFPSASRPS